jgi:hypothetical protein
VFMSLFERRKKTIVVRIYIDLLSRNKPVQVIQ